MSTTYLVIKENTSFRLCGTCYGTGKKTRTFQGIKFTGNCFMCGGTGKEQVRKTTYIPLEEALREINKKEL